MPAELVQISHPPEGGAKREANPYVVGGWFELRLENRNKRGPYGALFVFERRIGP